MLGYRVSLNGQCERHKYSQPFSPPPIASHQLQRSSPVKVKGEDSQRPKPSPADPLPILTSGMIAITPTLVIHILAVSRFRNKSHNYTKYFVCASILTPSRPSFWTSLLSDECGGHSKHLAEWCDLFPSPVSDLPET